MGSTRQASLEKALADLGHSMVLPAEGERLLKSHGARDFFPIRESCTSTDAFQDIPFRLPYTSVSLIPYHRKANFVLSVGDSSEHWYETMIRLSRR